MASRNHHDSNPDWGHKGPSWARKLFGSFGIGTNPEEDDR